MRIWGVHNENSAPHRLRFDDQSRQALRRPRSRFFSKSIETSENLQSLQFTDLADFRHQELCDIEVLLDFFQAKPNHVEKLVRPPFGRFVDLAKRHSGFRDPRVERDQLHDMRMPPYMRDSDSLPLSITRRQYEVLKKLLREAKKKKLKLKSPIERLSEELKQRRGS